MAVVGQGNLDGVVHRGHLLQPRQQLGGGADLGGVDVAHGDDLRACAVGDDDRHEDRVVGDVGQEGSRKSEKDVLPPALVPEVEFTPPAPIVTE